MVLCWEMGLTQLIFEGDCQLLVEAAHGYGVRCKEVYPLIRDIQYLLCQQPDSSSGSASVFQQSRS